VAATATVAITIPTIRDPARLGRCIDAARNAAVTDDVAAELLVVLDGADADVAAFVATEVHAATVLSWPERRGFAAALNAAARATSATYLAVLQDDARPEPGWLRWLLDTAQHDPGVGIVGSLVLGRGGTVLNAGAVIGGDGYIAVPWVGPTPTRDHFRQIRPVDYLSSSSVLVRRVAWDAVGGFDEEMYPLVYVDADFCTALWNAGWRVVLDPRSVVRHDAGGSTSARFREFLYHRNRTRFVEKWGSCFAGRPEFPTGQADPASVSAPGSWPRVQAPRRPEAPATTGDRDAAYLRRERDMFRAYVAELESQLEEAERDATMRRSRLTARWRRQRPRR